MHQGDVLRLVGQILDAVVHGERHFDDVALLPVTVDSDVARRAGDDADLLAVDLYLKLSGCHPPWVTHQQGELSLAIGDGDAAALAVGEGSLLTECDALLLPVQFRADEEVHVKGIAHMGVDELSVLAVILHACAHAAPHGLVRRRVVAVVTRTGGGEVHISSMLRMLRGEDVVEGCQLVIVGIAGLRITAMHVLRQLQHIVGVAGLRSVNVVDEVHAGLFAGEVLTA